MSSADDVVLRQWIVRRNAEAFQAIVQRHAGMVYATCRRILRNATEAEDVTQECFEALVQATEASRVKALAPWLHGMATNKSLMRIRSEGRRKYRETAYMAGQPVSMTASWDDIYSHVDEAIAELPEELRIPTVAHFFHGQSHAEFARATGIPRRTVSKRVERAVALIGESLRKRGLGVAALTLTSLLSANLAKAAPIPLSLSTTLGKLSLAQAGTVAAASALSTTGSTSLIGGIITMKKLMAAAVLVAAGVAFLVVPQVGRQKAPPTKASSSTEDASVEAATPTPVQDSELPGTAAAILAKLGEAGSGDSPKAGDDEVPVSGHVVDEKGNAVAEADVVITNHGSAQPFRTTRSQADGSFRFDGFSLAEIASVTYRRSYKIFGVQARKGMIRSKSKTCIMGRGPFTGLTLRVFSAASASGTVIDLDGRAVANIKVSAYPIEGLVTQIADEPDRVISDALGRFEFTALSPGEYKLIMREAYRPGAIGDLAEETGIEISLKERERRTGLVLEYDRMFSIAGRVLQEDGQPIKGRTVHAYGEWPTSGGAQAVTDETGRYEITDLVDGFYEIGINVGNSDHLGAGRKNVAADSRDVDFVLLKMCDVTGQVLEDATGLPVERFQLGLFKGDGDLENLRSSRGIDLEVFFDTISDVEGRFDVKVPHAGRSHVVAKAPGFAIAAQTIDVGNRRHVVSVVLRLKPLGRLEGVVKNGQGVPVENAAIFLGPVFQHLVGKPGNVVTDKDGTFTMGYSPHGVQVVSAYHQDYAPASTQVDSSRTQPEVIEIILTNGGTIEGHVTFPPQPGGRAVVTIEHSDGHRLSNDEAVANPDGTFELTGLTPGEAVARIMVRYGDPPSFRTVPFPVLIQDNGVTRIDLELPPASGGIQGTVAITGVDATPERVWGYFTTPLGDEEHFTFVMPDGSYQLVHVPAGSGVLRLEARDKDGNQMEASIPVEVGEGEVIRQDFDVAY